MKLGIYKVLLKVVNLLFGVNVMVFLIIIIVIMGKKKIKEFLVYGYVNDK